MKIPKYRVEYTSPGGTATNLSDVINIRVNYGIDAIKDTFQFSIPEKDNSNSIVVNGTVKIYLYYLGDSEVLVMDGIITELKNSIDDRQNVLVVKGNNVLEVLLNHQVRADSTGQTASAIIQNLLTQANNGDVPESRKITWDAGNDTTTKTVDYYSEYRPIFEHIEILSTDEYTGNGRYLYYLDQTNKTLVWVERPSTVSGTISYGNQMIEITRVRNSDQIVNFVIINAGRDLNDNTIHTYYLNPSSVGLNGWRTKYEVREEYANFIKLKYPLFTNDEVRTAVKQLARDNTARIIDEQEDATDQVDLTVQGSTSWSAGDLYDVVLPHAGWTTNVPKQLRLVEYEHNFNKTGWYTTLSFKEELI